MLVDKVVISQDRDDIEITGSLNPEEATKLERLARRFVYRFGLIGWRNTDINGFSVFNYLLSDARVRYSPNHNTDGNPLDFSFSYGETTKIRKFFEKFQRKFGKVDESKIVFD